MSVEKLFQSFLQTPIDMINTSDEKIAKSVGLLRWADKEKLKRKAAIFGELRRLGLQSEDDLEEPIKELHEQSRQEKKEVVRLDKKLKDFWRF